jgi:hypothetical protein
MKTPTRALRSLLASFLAMSAASAFAGPTIEFKQSIPQLRDIPLDTARIDVEQTFQSDFKGGHGFNPNEKSNNNTNTWHYEVQFDRRIPLNDEWYLRLGVYGTRYDFGNNRSVAPNTLNGYAGVIALDFFNAEGERGFYIESRPGMYFAHDLDSGAFDAPTDVVLAYPLSNKVYLIGGVTVGLLREYPVLPIGGVLWHINDKWDLRAYLPEPKLVYKISDKLEVWGGGEFTGGAFRNDTRSDIGAKELSGTPVEYYEIRGGGGLRLAAWQHFTVDFAAGWTFVRKFDFYRADVTQETNGAPYVKLVGTFEF